MCQQKIYLPWPFVWSNLGYWKKLCVSIPHTESANQQGYRMASITQCYLAWALWLSNRSSKTKWKLYFHLRNKYCYRLNMQYYCSIEVNVEWAFQQTATQFRSEGNGPVIAICCDCPTKPLFTWHNPLVVLPQPWQLLKGDVNVFK